MARPLAARAGHPGALRLTPHCAQGGPGGRRGAVSVQRVLCCAGRRGPHACSSLCLSVLLSEQRWTKRVPAAVRARSSCSS